MLLHRLGASLSFYSGAVAMVVSAVLLGSGSPPLFVAGLALPLHVRRGDRTFPSTRTCSTRHPGGSSRASSRCVSSTRCSRSRSVPGSACSSRAASNQMLPYALAGTAAVFSVLYFRWLGLHRVELRRDSARPVNPLRHVRRFVVQPRMRLAWTLALARAAWWMSFVILHSDLRQGRGSRGAGGGGHGLHRDRVGPERHLVGEDRAALRSATPAHRRLSRHFGHQRARGAVRRLALGGADAARLECARRHRPRRRRQRAFSAGGASLRARRDERRVPDLPGHRAARRTGSLRPPSRRLPSCRWCSLRPADGCSERLGWVATFRGACRPHAGG